MALAGFALFIFALLFLKFGVLAFCIYALWRLWK